MIERNWRSGRYSVRTLKGHTDGIMCLQFSENLVHPSFPVLISVSGDRTARIWNLETGKELRVLRGHTRGVRCLQFDEMKLITGSMDRTLKIWNWRTGELIRTLEGHTAGIVCLHFNDEILASGSQDSNIKVWNFRSGECFTLKGHEDWINAVQLWSAPKQPNQQEPPATFLFSASDDCTIRLWDLQTRECLMTYEGHVGQVQSIKLVMLDDDAVLKLTKGAAGGAGKGRNPAAQGANPSGSGDNDGAAARRRHLDRTYEEDVVDGDEEVATAAASAASAQCGYNPSNVPGDGRLANTNAPDLPERFFTTPIAGSSSRTANGDSDQGMRFVADERSASPPAMQPNGIPTRLLRLQERLSEAGLVPPIPYDAEIGDIDGGFSALQAEREEQTNAARDGLAGGDAGAGNSAKRSKSRSPTRRPCSKARPVLLSGSLDNTLKVFDVRTGRCIRTLFGHVEGVWSVDVDKLRIVSASHDRTIKIWDRDTAHCQTTLVGHRAAVTYVALGDDKIVSGSDDSEIKIWSFSSE
jgi:F-box and WD-40 domain protein MET30